MTGVDVTGVTQHNSPFWSFRPIYCKNEWIHDMRIEETYGAGDNTDGIDVDSSQNVVIERNYISCGDDHVTVLAGAGASGRAVGIPSKNVTIRDNVLGEGMGMSIGSSVSGGVEGVTYQRNVMTEGRYVNQSTYGRWGQGARACSPCHWRARREPVFTPPPLPDPTSSPSPPHPCCVQTSKPASTTAATVSLAHAPAKNKRAP